MTEPDVPSSDAKNIACRAVRDGDEWVINGEKYYISVLVTGEDSQQGGDQFGISRIRLLGVLDRSKSAPNSAGRQASRNFWSEWASHSRR